MISSLFRPIRPNVSGRTPAVQNIGHARCATGSKACGHHDPACLAPDPHDRLSRFDFVAVLGEPVESINRGSVMQLL
jgi:hypothetical protein